MMPRAFNAPNMHLDPSEDNSSGSRDSSGEDVLPTSRAGRFFGLPYGPLTTRSHLHKLVSEFAATVHAGEMVLDAGAGDSPYRRMFDHCTYEATDICKREGKRYAHINYICDLTNIPVESDRYDAVLCTQVLEHVPRPEAVLLELARVLRPNGRIWLSTPLSFEEHEVPYDFFRYTQFGLRELFGRAGLHVDRIDWVQGYCGTVAHQVNLARHMLPRSSSGYGDGPGGMAAAAVMAIARPFLGVLAIVLARSDMRVKFTAKGHCLDYYVIATKRG